MTPQERLRHHVTGAIERGEATPITEKKPVEKDTGNFSSDGHLTGRHYYSNGNFDDFDLIECDPPNADYWTAKDGVCRCFRVVNGSTCLASVEQLLCNAFPGGSRWDNCYVIWKPKTVTNAVWQRWQKKWSKRTARLESVSY